MHSIRDVIILLGLGMLSLLWIVPALAELNDQERALICQSHLKTLGESVRAYATDYDGYLPRAVDRSTKPWTWWYDLTRVYTGSDLIYRCPEESPEDFEDGRDDPLRPTTWNIDKLAYGMNWLLDPHYFDGQWVQLDQVTHPEDLVVLGDADFQLLRRTTALWQHDAAARHDGRVQFVFFDGSVAAKDPLFNEPIKSNAQGILNDKHWRPY